MNPLITIIIPTYNRAELLPFALKSALSQTFADFELLILDDASTDSTRETLEPYLKDERVRLVVHPENIGITANRNYGLSIAKGSYIAMLDSDDVWLDDCKLQRQKDILDTHPQCGLVGTDAKTIDIKGNVVGIIRNKSADRSIRRNMMRKNQFIQSSVLIRKEALDKAGWYDERIPIWEDYELWLRIGALFELRNIPEPLTGYRIHEGNVSNESKEKSIRAYEMIYRLHKKEYPWSIVILTKILVKKII
jgi:glycosyltransferase involved in cell wall biosynthesis